MKRNIPRKWVVTDEQIVEICKREPRTLDELFMVRGVSNTLKTDDARRVLAACKQGLDAPEDAWPELNKSYKSEPNVDPQVDLLYSLVKVRAKEAGVAFGVLASHADLAKIVRGHYEEVRHPERLAPPSRGRRASRFDARRDSLGIEDGVLKVTDRTH